MIISALYLYPIKSLGGIAVGEAVVEEKGFRYDRRFMLVSPGGECMTQRTNPQMALIDVAIGQGGGADGSLRVWHRHHPDDVLELPLTPEPNTLVPLPVSIWDSKNVAAVAVGERADRWFSAALETPCRLVYMPQTTRRAIDPAYARPDQDGRPPAVSFADGYPYLLIGQASFDDLNRRLPEPIEMLRFRPSIIVGGGLPYDEDAWREFQIGNLTFYGVKPCARCVLTTIDPATGQKGTEPLRTLTTYRQWKHKILFGQNVLADGQATGQFLRVGQPVAVVHRTKPWLDAPRLSSTA